MPREIPVTSARRKMPTSLSAKERPARGHTKGFKGAKVVDPVREFKRRGR